jgi:hypothetical protein
MLTCPSDDGQSDQNMLRKIKYWNITFINQSQWTVLLVIYTIASVTDQDEPSQANLCLILSGTQLDLV